MSSRVSMKRKYGSAALVRKVTMSPNMWSTRGKRSKMLKYSLYRALPLQFHVFERKTYINLKMYSGTGFGLLSGSVGQGNCLAFQFGLSGALYNVNLNGGVTSNLGNYSLPNSSEFPALYDQYRIDGVLIEFRFSNNNSSLNSPNISLPLLYIADDFDDANPISKDAICQYSKCKTTLLGSGAREKFSHRTIPKPLVQLYESAISTGYGNPTRPQWIDANDITVPHYGLKVTWDNTMNTAGTDTYIGVLDMVFTYRLSMKDTR